MNKLIPIGNVLKESNGGPGILGDLLDEFSDEKFSGYIRTYVSGHGYNEGVIVLQEGKQTFAFYERDGPNGEAFGPQALPNIKRDANQTFCDISVHEYRGPFFEENYENSSLN